MSDVNYRYMVEVKTDGTILVHPEIPSELEEATRVATAQDIVATSVKLAHDIDQQLIIDRVSSNVSEIVKGAVEQLVGEFLPSPEVTVPDKVKTALKDRGITPDNVGDSV